jgi:DNA polymerase-3 subunit beta
MHVTISQSELKNAVTLAGKASSAKSTLPALSCLLLDADAEKQLLTVSGTDLSMALTVAVPATVVKAGCIVIPARLLTDFVTGLPSAPVDLDTDEKTWTLALKCAGYDAKIKGMAPLEFPTIPQGDGETVAVFEAAALRQAINSVVFSASDEDHRPAMTGVHLCFRDHLDVVAADGFRLAMTVLPLSGKVKLTIAARAMNVLAHALTEAAEPITLRMTGNQNQAIFTGPRFILAANLIEARYPDYAAIIPKAYTTRAVVNRPELLRAVRVASYFAKDSANVIRLELSAPELNDGSLGKITVAGSAAEVGTGSSVVDCALEGPGNRIAFSARYLLEALTACEGDEVILELQAADRPGVLRTPAGKAIFTIMPMAG